MSRAVYPFALCLTLGLLATMWLRPGLAQELFEMASRIRAQSPDRFGSTEPATTGPPPHDPFTQVPYDSTARPPMQPVPVTRPVAWPGTPAPSSAPTDSQAPVSQAPISANSADNPAVKVWDPTGSRYAVPQVSAQKSSNQPPAAYPPSQPQTISPQAASPQAANPYYPPPPGKEFLAPGISAAPTAAADSMPIVQPPANPPSPVAPQPNNRFSLAPDLGAQNLQVWPGPPKDLPDAQVAARVGRQVILVSDLKAKISDHLHRNKIEIPPEQRELAYQQAYRPVLKQLIDVKLIYNDALETIPKEALPKIEAEMAADFDKKVLPTLLESHGASSVQELDRKMHERGSSLDFVRRSFFEENMAIGWKQQKVDLKAEVPHSDVLGYYKSHLADYEFPAKARWEELMVRFDRYPDKAAAHAAIAHMGIAVQEGRPFAEVAKAGSQGLTAGEGGLWDWTTEGSLTAKRIDEAIFGLPVGALSQIIETDSGFHIVRVVERTEAGRRPFIDVQPEIKKQIKAEKIQKQVDDYLDEVRARTPIWTMYDDQPGGIDGPQQERHSVFE